MRRLAVLAPIAVLVAVLLARRRRARAARLGAGAPPRTPAAALLEAPAIALLEPPPRFVSVPWTLVAAPQERAELTLRCTVGEQMELDRVDAQETPTQVFVTVLLRRQPADAGTPAQPREHEATVALSSPLGSRALVHAPADEPSDPPL
jgi:hypothetical protein